MEATPISELELASPLTLVEGSEPAAEALFLTYGAQLAFFERYALAAARSLGARVSVVADASMVSADAATVRRAGLRYLDGRVDLPGRAFHPKLVVLAGPNAATVAIGSANLTLGGWHGNAEIWSVLRARPTHGPRTLSALADFLLSLGDLVSAGPGVKDALGRSAAQLAALEATEEGPQLVHSLRGHILDQLPEASVDELHLYAPFFDRDLTALAALCERFDPRRIEVYIHPETSVDGAALERFLAERGAVWHSVAGSRYHHGKLIEWVTNGRRFALTGSPNLSAPALLATASNSGNVELGLITEVDGSLTPETATKPIRALGEHQIAERPVLAPELLVLGAVLEQRGIRIVLARALAQEATIELHRDDEWLRIGKVPCGQKEVILACDALVGGAGSALRLRIVDRDPSNTVFLTDLGAVTRPQIARIGKTQTNPAEIFSDLAVARAFAEDLARLRAVLTSNRAPGMPAASRSGDGEVGPDSTKLTIEEYLERCDAVFGETMIRFGLSIPALSDPAAPSLDPELTDGGEDDADSSEDESIRRIRDLSSYGRRRYRRWFTELFALAPNLPLGGQLIVNSLIIRAAAGDLWKEPGEWLGDLADLTCLLVDADADSEIDEGARWANIVIALLVLDAHIERHVGTDPAREGFDRVTVCLRGRLWADGGDAIEQRATETLQWFGRSLYSGDLAEVVDRATHPPDPLERAVLALKADFGITAYVKREEIRLDGCERPLRDPLLLALACAETDERIVASAITPRGTITAIWEQPELLIVRDTPRGRAGDLYRLPRGLRLPASRTDPYDLPRAVCSWMPGGAVPSAAARLLT